MHKDDSWIIRHKEKELNKEKKIELEKIKGIMI